MISPLDSEHEPKTTAAAAAAAATETEDVDEDDDDDDYRPSKASEDDAAAASLMEAQDESDSEATVEDARLKSVAKVRALPPRDDDDDDDDVVLIGSLRQQASTSTTPTPTSLLGKRKETNQLSISHSEPVAAVATADSVPRRQGSAVAEMRVPTLRSEPWPTLRTMVTTLGLNGRFTAVDIGRKNFAAVQGEVCAAGDVVFRLRKWALLDLDTLCEQFERENPAERFSERSGGGGGVYGLDNHCHCLFMWVQREARAVDGMFASGAVFIEQQAHLREMKALQVAVHTAVISALPSVVVRVNDPDLPPRVANNVSSAVIVSANSVKTCFAAYYPRVTETRTVRVEKARKKPRKSRAGGGGGGAARQVTSFGVGDANRGDDYDDPKQYAENKKNSTYFGQMIVPIERIFTLLGTAISAEQRTRFREAKKDDIYDAFWLLLYGLETWLLALYKRRKRGYGRANTMYGAVEQRRFRTYDALFEVAAALGTTPANQAELRRILLDYRTKHIDEEETGEEERATATTTS